MTTVTVQDLLNQLKEIDVYDLLKTCPECQGDGVVPNPLWEEFWERVNDACEAEGITEPYGIRYRQITENVKREVDLDYDVDLDDEPEEVECPTCELQGMVIPKELAQLWRMFNLFRLER